MFKIVSTVTHWFSWRLSSGEYRTSYKLCDPLVRGDDMMHWLVLIIYDQQFITAWSPLISDHALVAPSPRPLHKEWDSSTINTVLIIYRFSITSFRLENSWIKCTKCTRFVIFSQLQSWLILTWKSWHKMSLAEIALIRFLLSYHVSALVTAREKIWKIFKYLMFKYLMSLVD